MPYRKSIFTHIINGTDSVHFFNAANLELLTGDEEDYEYFNKADFNIENPNFDLLCEKQFITAEDINEISFHKRKRQARLKCAKKIRENTIGFLRISLTENCNLACKYCFVNDIFETKSNMLIDNFRKCMSEFLAQPNNKAPMVQYFGGEPLLRMDLIKEGHRMLEESKANGDIDKYVEEIVTNGTLLTREIAVYFINNNFNISFSIDGWQQIHDKNRIYPNGKGSYLDVEQGIKNYKDAGGELIAIITPTNENMPIFDKVVRFLGTNLDLSR